MNQITTVSSSKKHPYNSKIKSGVRSFSAPGEVQKNYAGPHFLWKFPPPQWSEKFRNSPKVAAPEIYASIA